MSAKKLKLLEAVLIHVGWNDTNIWRKSPPPPLPRKTITSISTCMTRIPGWQNFLGGKLCKGNLSNRGRGRGIDLQSSVHKLGEWLPFYNSAVFISCSCFAHQKKGPNMKASLFNWYTKTTKTVVSSFKFKAPKTNTSSHLQIDSGWALQIKWRDTVIHSTWQFE